MGGRARSKVGVRAVRDAGGLEAPAWRPRRGAVGVTAVAVTAVAFAGGGC